MKNTKTNANPKKNIFMSENIGQRRINFPWNISIIEIFQKKISLLCPIFSDTRMFIFGLAFVLYQKH